MSTPRVSGLLNLISRGWSEGTSLATLLFALTTASANKSTESSTINLDELDDLSKIERVQKCFDFAKANFGVDPPPCTLEEWTASKRVKTDVLVAYLSKLKSAASAPRSQSEHVQNNENITESPASTPRASDVEVTKAPSTPVATADEPFSPSLSPIPQSNNNNEVPATSVDLGKVGSSESVPKANTDPVMESQPLAASSSPTTETRQTNHESPDRVRERENISESSNAALEEAHRQIEHLNHRLAVERRAKSHLLQSVDQFIQQLQHFRSHYAQDSGGFTPGATHVTPKMGYMRSPLSNIATVPSPFSHHPAHAKPLPAGLMKTPNNFRHRHFPSTGSGHGVPRRGQGLPFSAQIGAGPFYHPQQPSVESPQNQRRINFPTWDSVFREPVVARTPATGTPPPFDLTLELQAELNAAGRRNLWTEDKEALARPPEHAWDSESRFKDTTAAPSASDNQTSSDKPPTDSAKADGQPSPPTAFFANTAHLRTPQNIDDCNFPRALVPKQESKPTSAASTHSVQVQQPSFMDRVEKSSALQRQDLSQRMRNLVIPKRPNLGGESATAQLQRSSTSRSRSRLGDSDSNLLDDTETNDSGTGSVSLARSYLFDDIDDHDDESSHGSNNSRKGGQNKTQQPTTTVP